MYNRQNANIIQLYRLCMYEIYISIAYKMTYTGIW